MISRRTLFARLSAVALAPLVKALGGTPPTKYKAGAGIALKTGHWTCRYNPTSYAHMLATIKRAEQRMFAERVKGTEDFYWGVSCPDKT